MLSRRPLLVFSMLLLAQPLLAAPQINNVSQRGIRIGEATVSAGNADRLLAADQVAER
jgi:hypothetical protein